MAFNSIVPQIVQNRQRDKEDARQRGYQVADQISGLYQNVGEKAYAEHQAGQARAREQAELDRPIAEPVSDLLNLLRDRMGGGKLPGRTAAMLWKLVQAGQITEDQAKAHLDGLGGSLGAAPGTSPLAPGAMTEPGANGAPPLPVKALVTEDTPQMRALAAEGAAIAPQARVLPHTPPPMTAPMPAAPVAASAPVVPPLAPPGAPVAVQGGLGPSPVGMAPTDTGVPVPPPPAHRWTVRDVNDLRGIGGIPQPREKSESELLMEIIKEQGRNNRTDTVVGSKEAIAAEKIKQDKEKLNTYVSRWNEDRKQQWAIAMANLNSREFIASGKFDANRDVKMLMDARAAISNLRNNDTKLRSSISALAKDPTVMQQIAENEALLTQAEARLTEMENMVRSRMGERPAGAAGPGGAAVPAKPSENSVTIKTTPTFAPPPGSGVPSVDEFLKMTE